MGIFCEEQYVFRRGKSCEGHVYNISTILKQIILKNENTFAAFIDLEKAFDCIDRNLLFYILLRYKIDGNMYCAIKSLYSNTYNTVRLLIVFSLSRSILTVE